MFSVVNFALMTLLGTSSNFSGTACFSLIVQHTKRDQREHKIGLFRMLIAVSIIIGPLCGGFLKDKFGLQGVFIGMAVLNTLVNPFIRMELSEWQSQSILLEEDNDIIPKPQQNENLISLIGILPLVLAALANFVQDCCLVYDESILGSYLTSKFNFTDSDLTLFRLLPCLGFLFIQNS